MVHRCLQPRLSQALTRVRSSASACFSQDCEFSAELGRLIDRKSEAAGSAGHELADRTNSLPGARFRLSTSIGDRTSQWFRDHNKQPRRQRSDKRWPVARGTLGHSHSWIRSNSSETRSFSARPEKPPMKCRRDEPRKSSVFRYTLRVPKTHTLSRSRTRRDD
jgi:hypothetical protein